MKDISFLPSSPPPPRLSNHFCTLETPSFLHLVSFPLPWEDIPISLPPEAFAQSCFLLSKNLFFLSSLLFGIHLVKDDYEEVGRALDARPALPERREGEPCLQPALGRGGRGSRSQLRHRQHSWHGPGPGPGAGSQYQHPAAATAGQDGQGRECRPWWVVSL